MRKILAILFFLSVAPAVTLAAPTEVLIFPAGAIVTEVTNVSVTNGEAVISLPSVANPQTLMVSVERGATAVTGLRIDSILADEGDFSGLREQLKAEQKRLESVQDKKQTQALSLAYWQNQKEQKFESVEAVQKMGTLLTQTVGPIFAALTRLGREENEILTTIKELERQLHQKTSRQNREWRVVVGLQESDGKTVVLRYRYRVHNASWSSEYLLDAHPLEKQVLWSWIGVVSQSTGIDWTDVRLKLATREPVFTLSPPALNPWVIREAQTWPMTRAKAQRAVAPEMTMADSLEMVEEAVAPSRQQGGLFDIYDLGKQTVRAGENYRFDIRKGEWKAAFTYLVRPIQSPQAFLTAQVELPELQPLPAGQANIMVDGVYIGQKDFSLHKKNIELALGNDPGIAVRLFNERETDETGLINKDKVQSWLWRVEISNNKSLPVELHVEDVFPRIEDKRIELTKVVAVPKVSRREKGNKLEWDINLQPGQSKQLEFGYRVKYPADMNVILGR
ncbi:MAG: DUF4139 domain-containing protein [Chloroflexi bacterium]|nr:DUF4139 domain-containing protein [Chloroflexota bacterium]